VLADEVGMVARRLVLFVMVSVLFIPYSAAAGLCKYLADNALRDTTYNVWVVFRNKPGVALSTGPVSAKTALRREVAGFKGMTSADVPIRPQYIEAVVSQGGKLREIVKWTNAASFAVPAHLLKRIADLPFVKDVIPVGRYVRTLPNNGLPPNFRKPRLLPFPAGEYGSTWQPLAMLGVPWAQAEIVRTRREAPGTGVVIASFDSGFWLQHSCFNHLIQGSAIVADSDFVDHDGDPYTTPADHGAQTMALIAGYDPPYYVGIAWGARFILARTENDASETQIEEDSWAAALIWAESLGVDIVTSSLGYRADYTDSLGNPLPDSVYTYADMNGRTTIIAQAAQAATDRGVIIVNAMGNESHDAGSMAEFGTIVSPADVKAVISVGAIDESGRIAGFSSTGPTADSVAKPDCVALGINVQVLATNGYEGASGTSFSTPQIAGLAALIKQGRPAATPDEIRAWLFRSCSFTPFQQARDNVYGWGIPDVFLAACVDTSESYLQVADSLGDFVVGAEVRHNTTLLATTDSFGVAIIRTGSTILPVQLQVRHPEFFASLVTIDSLYTKNTCVLPTMYFWVTLIDYSGNRLTQGSFFVRRTSVDFFREYAFDSPNPVAIRRGVEDSFFVYAAAPGFFPSPVDTILLKPGPDTIRITLSKPSFFWLTLADSVGQRLTHGTLFVRSLAESGFKEFAVDSFAPTKIPRENGNSFLAYATSPGFHPSSIDTFALQPGADTITIALAARSVTQLSVYPTVLSSAAITAGRAKGVTIAFCGARDDPRAYNQLCRIAIRSIDGQTIWEFSNYLRENSPLSDEHGNPLIWNCKTAQGKAVAPGLYFVIVRYADHTIIRKVLLNG
jgi:serine protease AprX